MAARPVRRQRRHDPAPPLSVRGDRGDLRRLGRQIGNPLIVTADRYRKSDLIAAFMRRAIGDWFDTRILIVTHVKELIAQNYGGK